MGEFEGDSGSVDSLPTTLNRMATTRVEGGRSHGGTSDEADEPLPPRRCPNDCAWSISCTGRNMSAKRGDAGVFGCFVPVTA